MHLKADGAPQGSVFPEQHGHETEHKNQTMISIKANTRVNCAALQAPEHAAARGGGGVEEEDEEEEVTLGNEISSKMHSLLGQPGLQPLGGTSGEINDWLVVLQAPPSYMVTTTTTALVNSTPGYK